MLATFGWCARALGHWRIVAWLSFALAVHAAALLCQGPLVEFGPYADSSAGSDRLQSGLFTSGHCDARQCWYRAGFDLLRPSQETGFSDATGVFFMSLIVGVAIALVSGAFELADRAPGGRVWLALASLLVIAMGYLFAVVWMKDLRLLPLCWHVVVCCIGAAMLQVFAARWSRYEAHSLTPARLLG
jgi:hypothetical protein